MSFSFYTKCKKAPPVGETLAVVGNDDLVCAEWENENPTAWPEGVVHLFRPNRSTRGVEVAYQGGEFQVRLLILSSPEDHELALQLLGCFAASGKGKVRGEDGTVMAAAELVERYGQRWNQDNNDSGARALTAMVESQGQTVTVPGCIRDFHVGPRLLAEIRAAGPDKHLARRLVETMRNVQFAEGESYFAASIFQLRGPEDQTITCTAFAPEVAYLLPAVDYLIVLPGGDGESGEEMFLPLDALAKLPVSWKWLDEKQVLVEAVAREEWPDLLEKARAFEAHPLEKPATKRKKKRS